MVQLGEYRFHFLPVAENLFLRSHTRCTFATFGKHFLSGGTTLGIQTSDMVIEAVISHLLVALSPEGGSSNLGKRSQGVFHSHSQAGAT